jgi:hypothetical protein
MKQKGKIMKNKPSKTGLIMAALATLAILLVACGEATPIMEETAGMEADASVAEIVQDPADQLDSVQESASPVEEVQPVKEEITNKAQTSETEIVPEGENPVETAEKETVLRETTSSVLSNDEIAGLLFMREEEKLAHDVYLTLYELWGQQTFAKIAESEQTHTDTIRRLLDAYGLEDPAAGREVGDFADTDLQALYDQLVVQGSASLDTALRVGAAIEEIDILDLEEQLDRTDKDDIRLVYENLRSGSENHLRAFTSVIEKKGGTYQPDYLSQDAYDLIVSTSSGRGNGYGKN